MKRGAWRGFCGAVLLMLASTAWADAPVWEPTALLLPVQASPDLGPEGPALAWGVWKVLDHALVAQLPGQSFSGGLLNLLYPAAPDLDTWVAGGRDDLPAGCDQNWSRWVVTGRLARAGGELRLSVAVWDRERDTRREATIPVDVPELSGLRRGLLALLVRDADAVVPAALWPEALPDGDLGRLGQILRQQYLGSYLGQGSAAFYLPAYQSLAAAAPASYLARVHLALSLLESNRVDEASAALGQALELNPQGISGLMGRATLAANGGDLAGLAVMLEQIDDCYPRDGWAARSLVLMQCAWSAGARRDHGLAEALLRRRVDLVKREGNRYRLAQVQSDFGQFYVAVQKFDAAEEQYAAALALQRELLGAQDTRSALTAYALAGVLRSRGRVTDAEALHREALATVRQTARNNPTMIANCLTALALCLADQQRFDEAQALFREAVDLARAEVGPRAWLTGVCLSYLASNLQAVGRAAEAEPLWRELLAIQEQLVGRQHPWTAGARASLAANLAMQARWAEAAEQYQQALTIYRQTIGRQPPTADVIRSLADVVRTRSGPNEAIPLLQEALEIYRETQGDAAEATALTRGELADQLMMLGRFGEAEQLYRRALLVIQSTAGPISGEAAACHAQLAALLLATGRTAEAEQLLRGAISVATRAVGEQAFVTLRCRQALGELLMAQLRYQEAEEVLARLWPDAAASLGEAHALTLLSHLFLLGARAAQVSPTEDNEPALRAIRGEVPPLLRRLIQVMAFDEVANLEPLVAFVESLTDDDLDSDQGLMAFGESMLAVARVRGLLPQEAEWLIKFMQTQAAAGNPRAAIVYGKAAVNLVQTLRGQMKDLDEAAQQAFLVKNETLYEDLADLLIGEGRLLEAQRVLDLLKEDEFFDFVRRRGEAAGRIDGTLAWNSVEQPWMGRYREIGDQLLALGREYDQLRPLQRNPAQEARFIQLREDLRVAREAFSAFLQELNTAFAAEDRRQFEEVKDAQQFRRTLAEMGDGNVAVYTAQTRERLHLILYTAQTQKAVTVEIEAGEANHLIHELRQALQDPRRDPRPAAEAVYDLLLRPIEADLEQAGATTIFWSLGGAFRYVPVAALWDGQQWALERWRHGVINPAVKDHLQDSVADELRGLGLGCSLAYEGFPALPGVRDELAAVFGERQPVAGGYLIDTDFTATALKRSLEDQPPLLHIATHFRCQPGTSADSFLLLGDGSHLTLDDIQNLPQVLSNVDLITLSACDTALAGGDGAELDGLAMLMQYLGADAVVASLWSVADDSTRLLMETFYRRWRSHPELGKLEAFRQAQLDLLHGQHPPAEPIVRGGEAVWADGSEPFTAPADAPFAHPFYWAPFILIGNPR